MNVDEIVGKVDIRRRILAGDERVVRNFERQRKVELFAAERQRIYVDISESYRVVAYAEVHYGVDA